MIPAPERKKHYAAAMRWASRVKGESGRKNKRRCAAQCIQHLKAMLTGEPVDPAPDQGKLL